MISPIQVSKVTWLLRLPARGGYKKCPPPYKTKNFDSFKHRHVAYQNDRIEMLADYESENRFKILLLVRIRSH